MKRDVRQFAHLSFFSWAYSPWGDQMESIWQKTCVLPEFPSLQQDMKTDILIVGGGLAGLLCAYRLDEQGADYCLIEANRICSGVSANTTAKITAQHGLVYHKLLSRFGADIALDYYDANANALTRYRALSKKIDCDFIEEENVVWNSEKPGEVLLERKALEQLEIPHFYLEKVPLNAPCQGAICFEKQARVHPLKFAAGISEGLHIFEHTPAFEIRPDSVWTGKHTIHANRIVVATHFPVLKWRGLFFLKQYQSRSYALALENAGKISGMYLDEAKKGLSFRMQGEYLILGGGGHRTGKKGGGWDALEEYAKTYLPNARIAARWATQDCMTLDEIPYIGRLSEQTDTLFVSTGFNKWGMTSAMAGALLLEKKLRGEESPWERLYNPSRSILRRQLVANGMGAAANLLRPTAPRCTHMGCALHWNEQEQSWDCSCHGSRFDEKGRLLDNPAHKDLNI